MNKILVPTDFSDCANTAVISAGLIASKTGASIALLHSVDSPVDWVKLPKEKENDFPETKEKIGKARYSFEKICSLPELQSVKTETYLGFNMAHSDIIKYSREINADLIVMGTHGSSGFFEKKIGSNTQKVVRVSECPVLAVKKKPIAKIKKIVFASNFEEDISKQFQKIVDFASAFNAEIELLYINTPDHFRESTLMESIMEGFSKDYPAQNLKKTIYNALSVERGISGYSSKTGADMIALITHGSFRMFKPAITEKVINRSLLPVMSINIH
jgi:nucleotide-binding universal stress UspA family protein